jgi:hypothetical protein
MGDIDLSDEEYRHWCKNCKKKVHAETQRAQRRRKWGD